MPDYLFGFGPISLSRLMRTNRSDTSPGGSCLGPESEVRVFWEQILLAIIESSFRRVDSVLFNFPTMHHKIGLEASTFMPPQAGEGSRLYKTYAVALRAPSSEDVKRQEEILIHQQP
ncbi:hypothetical protein HUJ05_002315 [Dendroctonus ponderosae]|nr:hypothetical protein HUJ05_002315 [Dendroctonus ponderosae]